MYVSNGGVCHPRARYLVWALLIGITFALLPAGEVRAQGMDMKNMPGMKKDMPAQKGATQSATATGTITALDGPGRKVTLDHEPIPAINWPAMKMEFPVAPSVDLSKVKTGDRVRFTLSGSGSSYTVQS